MASLVVAVAALMFLTTLGSIEAADPDPIQDFCILPSSSTSSVNQCKSRSAATGMDFSSQALRGKFNQQPPSTFNATLVTSSLFPALNTMGLAIARADLGIGGVVPAHVHPRASELVYIEAGTVEAGFVDTNNVLYSHTLEQGDMLIVPRGLLHYQYNVGKTRATVLASFNSQDPGVGITGQNLFSSDLPDAVIAASLLMDESSIQELKNKFKPSN